MDPVYIWLRIGIHAFAVAGIKLIEFPLRTDVIDIKMVIRNVVLEESVRFDRYRSHEYC